MVHTKMMTLFITTVFYIFTVVLHIKPLSDNEIYDNKNVREMFEYLNQKSIPNLCKTKNEPKLVILDETINGNIVGLEYNYYIMNGTNKMLIGGNSYKYKVKDDRIQEEQWYGAVIDGKPITKRYYYSNKKFIPDSIKLDNSEKIIREYGDRLFMAINTFNKIDKKGFLIQRIETSAKPNVEIRIYNYDSSGRLVSEYYTDVQLSGKIENKRFFENQYEYVGDKKFQINFLVDGIVSKYEFIKNTNKPIYRYFYKNGEMISKENALNSFEAESDIKYDSNNNWISKKKGSDTFIERNISYK